jgi:DNA polymerase-1
MSHPRLIVIDAMGAIYRAFYAIKELSTADGRPTNAVFGFIRMITMIRETWHPTHWAVVFEGGLPEERMELVPEYKGNRDPMPDPLSQQLDVIEEYLELAAIPSVCVEGEEADDAMAALAIIAKKKGMETLIATSDKDLYQVVCKSINIIPLSGHQEAMDSSKVKEKMGVNPSQIAAWLALVGDSADNIPGVPGIGPKTASKLLNAYKTLDGIWENIESIEREKLRDTLREYEALARKNEEMVTLRTAIDCDTSLDELCVAPPDTSKLLAFFEDLEFKAMARALKEPELLL